MFVDCDDELPSTLQSASGGSGGDGALSMSSPSTVSVSSSASPSPSVWRSTAAENSMSPARGAVSRHQSLPPAFCDCGGLGWFFRFWRSLLASACSMRSACSLLMAPFSPWPDCACACCGDCCGCFCCGCGFCCGGCLREESGCDCCCAFIFQQYSRFCFALTSSGRSSSDCVYEAMASSSCFWRYWASPRL